MRTLFSFVGGRGHAEPLLPLARVAVERGHDVAFAAQSAMLPWLAAEGFTAFAAGPSTVSTVKQPLLTPDRDNEARVLRDHFAGSVARGRASDLVPVFSDWRPDVVVCDDVDFGAMVVADRLGVPKAIVVVLAAGGFATPVLLAGALNELRAEHGLPADPDLSMLRHDLVVAPLPPSFRDPDDPLPATTLYVRPSALEPPGATALPALRADRPTVYVTLGTIFNLESGDLFTRMLAGLGDAPWNVVVTVGPHLDPSEFSALASNIHIESFLPHAGLLPRCDVVVCHGGSGTVIGALSHGVPLVNIPMGADQMHNADRCEDLGVGITRDVMTVTPEEIRHAVSVVMAQPRYRTAAAVLRDESASLPDAHVVLDELDALSVRASH